MFVTVAAFFNKIADVSLGGTIITLLNTVNNLGARWPSFFVFRAIDWFGVPSMCQTLGEVCSEQCPEECTEAVHGIYIVQGILMCYGLFYMIYLRKMVKILGEAREDEWSPSNCKRKD